MGMFDALRGRRDTGAGGQEDRRPAQGEPAQDRVPTDPGSEKATDLSDRYASKRQARSSIRLPDEFSARGPVDSAGPGLSDRLLANLAKTVDDGLDLGPQR